VSVCDVYVNTNQIPYDISIEIPVVLSVGIGEGEGGERGIENRVPTRNRNVSEQQ
jgi:hypothetical protein